MFRLIENHEQKLEGQKKLENTMRESWRRRETRTVVWRPSSKSMTTFSDGSLWFGSSLPTVNVPRFLNWFGVYKAQGNLEITVEINNPIETDRRVSGFLAGEADEIYLMHDGAVGGGRAGVGRDAFLEWSSARPVEVVDANDDVRLGLVIARLGSKTAAQDIGNYVQTVLGFKKAVKNGYSPSEDKRDDRSTYKSYFGESSGKRKRARIREIEYISRHGEIVAALQAWRDKSRSPDGRIVKNVYIDLGYVIDNELVELYEVKTNCDRQTLYGALGQILVHDNSTDRGCRRYIVVPSEERVPDDIARALKEARVATIRFQMTDRTVRILR